LKDLSFEIESFKFKLLKTNNQFQKVKKKIKKCIKNNNK